MLKCFKVKMLIIYSACFFLKAHLPFIFSFSENLKNEHFLLQLTLIVIILEKNNCPLSKQGQNPDKNAEDEISVP